MYCEGVHWKQSTPACLQGTEYTHSNNRRDKWKGATEQDVQFIAYCQLKPKEWPLAELWEECSKQALTTWIWNDFFPCNWMSGQH
jgi:hypothetical protein